MQHIEHAPAGGIVGEADRFYSGGEFLPFYKPRPLMPQVDDKAYPALLDWCAFMGVAVTRERVEPAELKPHQRIDIDKARAIPASVLSIPLLVSADGYILDGNHRWFAHVQAGRACDVVRLGLAFDDAIAALFEFLRDTPNATLQRELTLAEPKALA